MKITELFATPMAEFQMPDHEPVCASLAELFLEKSTREEYRDRKRRITQYGPLFESRFDLFKWPDEPVPKLARFCHASLSRLIQDITHYDKERLAGLRFDYHAWFHVTRKGGYQTLHNHQNASWSGIFCVDPGDSPEDRPDSGVVRFHDPRFCSWYYSDAGNLGLEMPWCHGGWDLVHRAGRLMIFPSFLMHEILPYAGERPRIVVAFNCSVN